MEDIEEREKKKCKKKGCRWLGFNIAHRRQKKTKKKKEKKLMCERLTYSNHPTYLINYGGGEMEQEKPEKKKTTGNNRTTTTTNSLNN